VATWTISIDKDALHNEEDVLQKVKKWEEEHGLADTVMIDGISTCRKCASFLVGNVFAKTDEWGYDSDTGLVYFFIDLLSSDSCYYCRPDLEEKD